MPTMPAYEGKTDPRQHIMRYGWMMDSARANDATKCRCFPITLSGIATMWFTRLQPRSISNFDELATKFLEQFRIHTTRPKDVMSLSNVTQKPGEPLKTYLQRFQAAATEVSNPNDLAILMAVMRGVDPDSEFGEWLAGKPPIPRLTNISAGRRRDG